MLRRLVVVVHLILVPLMLRAAECVPTTRSAGRSVISPNRKYKVSSFFCSNAKGDRVLILTNLRTGEHRLLYTYTRDATVLWSPDSQRIAVNDYAGSDFTRNVVYSVDPDQTPFDVQRTLGQAAARKDQRLPAADHLYMSVTKWESDRELDVLVWGHGGEVSHGFCECRILTLAGEIRECRRKIPEADPEDYCERNSK